MAGPDTPALIKTARIRFYAELNDFLRNEQKQKSFDFSFRGNCIVKDAIESLGVPHTAIDLVLVNGFSVGFKHVLKQGDYISVYPEFETLDISDIAKSRKKPLRDTRFVIDAHLGKLARKLRLLGFDSVYENSISDEEIIDLANAEKRIILTRDKGILKSGKVSHGYYVRAIHPAGQLKEVISKFDLASQFRPFTRCLVCNHELEEVRLSEIQDQIEYDTANLFQNFFRCPGCKRIFWEGSHYERMKNFVDQLSRGNPIGDF